MPTALQRVAFLFLAVLINASMVFPLDAVRRKRRRASSGQVQKYRAKSSQQAAKKGTKRRRRYPPQVVHKHAVPVFSKTICRFFSPDEMATVVDRSGNMIVWEQKKTDPFSELIVSWNALRPQQGYLAIWVSVLHQGRFSRWHHLADWGHKMQKTYLDNNDSIVHTKHNRVELLHGNLARGFRVKVVFRGGAQPSSLKALFGCISRLNQRKEIYPDPTLKTVMTNGHTKISQFMLDHERKKDLCAPVSTSMMVSYFHKKHFGKRPHYSMSDYALNFAKNVHDQGDLNVYGNWNLNTAHAFDAMQGEVYFSAQRLNSFYDLYHYLSSGVPVVVSVRKLKGGATPYASGHLLMVIGWNNKTKRVMCLDPAFSPHHATRKSYSLWAFIRAWGRSNNMSYVPMLKSMVGQKGSTPLPESVSTLAMDEQPMLDLPSTDLVATAADQLHLASLQQKAVESEGLASLS